MRAKTTRSRINRFLQEPLSPANQRSLPKGRLLIIGGHEAKQNGNLILKELARLIGGGKLVVSTVATERPTEAWNEYESVFRSLGIRHVFHLHLDERQEGAKEQVVRILDDATGVFFAGGDQLKLTSILSDTPLYSRITEVFLQGGVIAGTSAGASVMSETMLVESDTRESYRIRSALQLAPGFGFTRDLVIDQHFAERGRIGRLLGVVGQNPRILGVGIDENTAIELRPQRDFFVLGEGGVTVLDGRTVTMSNVAEEERDRTISLFGVTLHVLSQGDRFDLRSRRPKHHAAEEIERELGLDARDGAAERKDKDGQRPS